MTTRRIFLYMCVCIVLSSCQTYETFYKKTATIDSKDFQVDQRLDASNSTSSEIKDKLSKFNNIHALDLSNNPSLDLEGVIAAVSNPKELRVLILDGNHLEELPANLHRFSNLTQISLNNNPKLQLEQAFYILTTLPIIFLNLQDNELRKLPSNVASIRAIEDLNLSGNHLDDNETYSNLSKLPALNSLWLTRNKLDTLPSGLFELINLKNLYIEHNELSNISVEISKMKGVWVLHAGHNNFKELPAAFAKMPSLMLLHVNNCDISTIPDIYATKESNVLGLILDNNKLTPAIKKRWKKELRRNFLLSME